MNKNIAILFSGGLDSTYLMWKALKDGHKVYPIYISIKNNENKVLVEKQQCKLLIDKFNEEFNEDIKLNESASIEVHNSNNIAFAQPFLWSTLVNLGLDGNPSEIQMGYVYGDAVIAYIPEIKKTYNSAKPFIRYQPKLTFPITKTTKDDIVNELPEQYRKLVVSCENPILKNYSITNKETGFKYRFFEPCGNCEVCRKIIDNNYYYCDETKKNYNSAELIYNESKYKEYKFKHNKETLNLSDAAEDLEKKAHKLVE
jgi:hypothetical protein